MAGVGTTLAGCSGGGSGGGGSGSDGGDGGSGGATGPSGEPQEGGTLVWGHSEVTQELDVHLAQTAASSRFLNNVHETLVGLSGELEISTAPDVTRPGLAADWEINDDRTEYTFTLRDGVTFHDGSELTSADVRYTFERIMDPDVGARYSGVLTAVESIETPDDSTVVLSMSERYNPLLRQLAFTGTAIIPEGSASEQASNPVGTGPFVFESRQQGNRAELSAFDDYWGEGPYVDTLEERTMTDPDTRLTGLTDGDLDYINDIPLDDMSSYVDGANDAVQTSTWRPLAFNHMYLHNDRPPFDSVNWRRAIDFALDKQELVEGALFGQGSTLATPSFPNSPYRNDDLDPRPQDVEQARSLIEDSEYGIDEFAPIEFKVTTNYPWHVTAATIMEQHFSEVGLDVEIQELQWGDWLTQVTSNMDYRMAMVNWFGGWEPAQMYRGLFHSEGSFNSFAYASDDFDSAIENAETAPSEEEEVEYYREAQRVLHEEVPSPMLWFRDGAMAAKPSVGGIDTVLAPNNTEVNFGSAWLDE
ncbi:ABC transporter periplasmic protein [Halorubrum tebenquichense DSM 14210]|uniref:ABC transporter periplasmic protein n=2 Tax=Halorubrum tebenquichense TaxID=119434 RepID=M0DQX0_9EURY|nr:ABC transporter periplasmic protein [Halorubrum tebenquichense DSM 14210]